MNTANETIRLTGIFSMRCIDAATGEVIDELTENNLVVTLGKTNMAKLLGGDAAGEKINQVAVGENTSAPAPGDTGPLSNQFKKNVDSATYPDANSVLFSWTLGTGDANGLAITEFGLLNESDVLCARKTRSVINKTNAFSIVGSWKIFIN